MRSRQEPPRGNLGTIVHIAGDKALVRLTNGTVARNVLTTATSAVGDRVTIEWTRDRYTIISTERPRENVPVQGAYSPVVPQPPDTSGYYLRNLTYTWYKDLLLTWESNYPSFNVAIVAANGDGVNYTTIDMGFTWTEAMQLRDVESPFPYVDVSVKAIGPLGTFRLTVRCTSTVPEPPVLGAVGFHWEGGTLNIFIQDSPDPNVVRYEIGVDP